MRFTNLFITRDRFTVARIGSMTVQSGDVDANPGDLLVTGNLRKGPESLRISQVRGSFLVDIGHFSAEQQINLLETVKGMLTQVRARPVFFYEAAWRRAVLRTCVRGTHRVHTLPQQIAARQRRASNEESYRLATRAKVANAA